MSDAIRNNSVVSIKDLKIPTLNQFKQDYKFQTIIPKHTNKKLFIGNCNRCGLTVKYTKGKYCMPCGKKREHGYEHERSSGIIKTAKIYRIIQNNTKEIVYIGSTSRRIEKRISTHKYNSQHFSKRKLYKYIIENNGWSNFSFDVIYYSEIIEHSTIEQIAHQEAALKYIELKYILEFSPKCNQNRPINNNSKHAEKILEDIAIYNRSKLDAYKLIKR